MSDGTVVGTYSTATVTDRDGNEIAHVAGWFGQDGRPITDPALIARLEANMPKGKTAFERKQDVEILENDDETWSAARVVRDNGNGVYLVRKLETGQVIGTTADRLRAAESTDGD